jgi:hypothetical protein
MMTRVGWWLPCLFVAAVAVRAETVAVHERPFVVRHADGGLERYLARWTAIAEFSVREEGGPAEPLKGKFTDDRRCHWSSVGKIERQVFIARKGGQLLDDPDKRRLYTTDFANDGSTFSVNTFRPENCNDAAARRDSDFNNTRAHLRSALSRTAERDLATLRNEYAGEGELLSARNDVDRLCYAGTWDEDVRGKFTWRFQVRNGSLDIRRHDAFATGTFTRVDDGWIGTIRWGNGETWPDVKLANASPSCDEVRTNQIWYFKRY